MTPKDKISDKYLKQVEQFVNNSTDAFSSRHIEPEELDEIWEDIRSELDIGDIWTGISAGLDTVMPTDSGPGLFLKGCAVGILILSMLVPVRRAIPEATPVEKKSSPATSLNEQSHNVLNNDESADPELSTKDQVKFLTASGFSQTGTGFERAVSNEKDGRVLRDYLLKVAGDTAPVTRIKIVSEEDENEISAPGETILYDTFSLQAELLPGNLEIIKIATPSLFGPLNNGNNPTSRELPPPPDYSGRLSGGMIASFRNTWLLNRETFYGLRSETLTTTLLVVFPDAGLSLNYSPARRWSLQADAFLCSTAGQEYSGYIYGHYSQKKIILRYSTVAISAKYKTSREDYPAKRSSINFSAGGYISFLQHARQRIDGDISEIRAEYRKFDCGIRLGSEFELLLNERLSVAPGVSLSLGIPNIYKGDGIIPGYMRRTHNGSADIHLSFYYQFK